MIKKRTFAILLFFLLGIVTSACSQRVEMNFFKSGQWRVKSVTTYTNAVTNFTGGFLEVLGVDIGGESGLTNLTKTATMTMFNVAKNVFREMEIDMDWSQKQSGDDTILSVETQADSLNKFNTLISSIGDSRLNSNSDGNYHLQLDFQGLNQEMFDLLGLSDVAPYIEMTNLLNDYELRINTARIISSNADEEKGRTAIWYNPQYVDIVFKPLGTINFGLIIIVFLIIAVAIGVVVFILRASRTTKRQDTLAGDYSSSSDPDSFFKS